MFKKVCFIIISVISIISLGACHQPVEETDDIILPNLSGMNKTQALDQFSEFDLNVTVIDVINNDIMVGRFISYNEPYIAGMIVLPDTEIILYFVKQANELPDLSGMNQTEIIEELSLIDVNVSFEYIDTNAIQEGLFVQYGDLLKSGDIVDIGTEITIDLATPFDVLVYLPNLSGLNEAEIEIRLSAIDIDFDIQTIQNNDVSEGYFVQYEGLYITGSAVPLGQAIIVYVAEHVNMLPDLDGLNQTQIISRLAKISVIIEFKVTATNDIEEGLFVNYGNDLQSGDIVKINSIVIIYIAQPVITVNTNLMISSYLEGALLNRAIELYNVSDEPIDLSNYKLVLYLDGLESVGVTIDLEGILLAKDVYVIAHENSNESILSKANLTTQNLIFNGNDAVALQYYNDVIVDIVGNIGWGLYYLSDRTLVRDGSVSQASDLFNIDEWDEYRSDYDAILGIHPTQYPVTFTFDSSFLTVPFTEPGGMIEVEYVSIYDGDTAYFTPGFLGDNRVRFIGIDTTEIGSGTFAIAARNFVASLLSNATTIYLQHDPESGIVDTYGRSLALVWADGVLINYEVVLHGYSQNNYQDPTHALIFNNIPLSTWMTNAEKYAKENHLGVWA